MYLELARRKMFENMTSNILSSRFPQNQWNSVYAPSRVFVFIHTVLKKMVLVETVVILGAAPPKSRCFQLFLS